MNGGEDRDDPLARILGEVAAGRPPTSDGTVDVLPSRGPAHDDVVLALDGRLVITTDIDEAEVRARFPAGDYLAWCDPRSVLWLAQHAGRELGTADILLATTSRSGPPPVPLVPLEVDHPRLVEGRLRRSGGRGWATADGAGMVSVARGLAGRWELAYEVEPAARGRGLGVALVRAARHLVPVGRCSGPRLRQETWPPCAPSWLPACSPSRARPCCSQHPRPASRPEPAMVSHR